ncbi:MAG: hypothetical protein KA137_09245, partial [Halioglobus sp.]|nr:hypothetical protein [Halioglobus sp.]
FQLAMGRSSFNAPLIVHLHAVVFMGWLVIILAQAWLGTGGNLVMHRRLGRLAVVWAFAIVIFGTLVTIAAIQTGRVPFFFQPQHFLIANPLTIVGFIALLGAAIVLRKQTDWHMRLQVGAFVMLMGPGFGRLIPMPLLKPYAFEIACLLALVFPFAGMIRDWRVRGRPHRAWVWGICVLIGVLLLARWIAFSPVGNAIYSAATSGSPTAGTDGLAFPPPPPGTM